jgi:hypothetical protein
MVGFGALATCSGRSARVEMVGYGARATCSGRSARVEMVGYGARATCSGRSARVEMVGQACSGSADLQVRVQHLVLALPSRLQPATAFSSTCLISSARESRHIFFKRAALGSQQNLRIRYNGKAPRFRRFHNKSSHGEMAEWLKAHAWKACVLERVPRVRIPVSPPFSLNCRETPLRCC